MDKAATVLMAMLLCCSAAFSSVAYADEPSSEKVPVWQKTLAKELPVLGHRNWIIVADAAYPAQSREGIQTIYVGGDQIETVQTVLQAVDKAKHIQAIVHLDSELASVAEEDAPGITDFRRQLQPLLKDRPVKRFLHREMIDQLDEAAKTFRILILKTDAILPYTSVFIRLDCGYWNDAAEQRLRSKLQTLK